MTTTRVEFTFGDVLPANDPVARWITVLGTLTVIDDDVAAA